MTPDTDPGAVSISQPADIRRAAEVLCDFAASIGLRAIITDDIASKRPMVDADAQPLALTVFGWTEAGEEWWQDKSLALRSPVARACRYESEPFWVNPDGFRTRQTNPYLDAIDMSAFAKNAFMLSSIVVPVHLPFGQIGMAAFGRSEVCDLQAEFDAHADTLTLLAQRFVASYAKVTRKRQWLPVDCQLTKREIECLRWAAVGKTDKEIAMIIGRSHATIRFHVQNAGEKLNAVNRSQTIFKASQLGYLGLAH